MSIKKKFDLALATLGEIYNKIGDYDKAIEASKRSIEITPHIKEAWFVLGNAHYNRGEYDFALSALDNALALDSKYFDAMYCKAEVFLAQGDGFEAYEICNKILELNPNHKAAQKLRKLALS